FNGSPLAEGNVYFKRRDQGEIKTFSLQDGKFSGKAAPGTWRVEIVAFKDGPMVEPMPGEPPEPSRVNYIPSQYNSLSELSAEVTAEGPNQFSWELEGEEAGKS
ncbi:MAG: hypothetical protein ACOC8H_00600, partial [bacterium]